MLTINLEIARYRNSGIRADSDLALGRTGAFLFAPRSPPPKIGMTYEICPYRPYSDPEKAVRKFLEIANSFEAVQDGRIHIEKINAPFLYRKGATPAEHKAGLDLAIARGCLVLHESGTFVRFRQAGAYLFA